MKTKNNMLEGNPVKSIITFAFPIMLSSLLQYNYTLVDNIIVGRYVSTNALAAVGSVAPVNSFVIGAALGLTSGFTIPVSHGFGAGDSKKVTRFAGNSISLALIIGVIIAVVAHTLSTPLLRLIGTPSEIIDLSSAYVNILYYAVPFQMLSNNFTAISRAVGESKKPLYFYTVSVIINFILDLVFVKSLSLGVEGAAFATLISQAAAALLTGIYVIKFNKNVTIKGKDLKPDLKTSWRQIILGIPVSIQFTVTSVGSMCMQSAVNSFGADVIAGFTAAGRVENLTNLPMSALGVATQTFVGQNYGAKNYSRITSSVKKIFLTDIAVSVLMSGALLLIGPPVVRLFMSEYSESIMFAAKRYLIATAECYSLVAVLFVMRNTLQGLGFTYANMIAGAGEFFGRLSVAFIFTPLIGFDAVCYSAPAAWLLADIPITVIYLFKHRKFKRLARESQIAPSHKSAE